MINLKAEPLCSTKFAPFGEVIDTSGDFFDANYGMAQRYNNLITLNFENQGGNPSLSIFRSKPLNMPMKIQTMEKHELGSQAFIGLQNQPFLALVAPPGDKPDVDKLRLFKVKGGQGVNYFAGTWHHYLICLDNETDFLCIDRQGASPDCFEYKFQQNIAISL